MDDNGRYPPNSIIGVTMVNFYAPPVFSFEHSERTLNVKASMRVPKPIIAPVCTNDNGDFECWYIRPGTNEHHMFLGSMPAFFLPFAPFELSLVNAIPFDSPRLLERVLDQDNRRKELAASLRLFMLMNKIPAHREWPMEKFE
jgi:hypothetical protein